MGAVQTIRRGHAAASVVTHGGVVGAALAHVLGLPDAHIFRLEQSYGGITIVDWVEETPIVRQLNAATL